jgi:outer membrane receptor for ferrienterochelin and colicins
MTSAFASVLPRIRLPLIKRYIGSSLLLLACLTSFSPACAAQSGDNANRDLTELGLQELMEIEVVTVYGASKFEQKLTEAPAAVSIVTSSDIKRYGHRTLADILRGVRGFYTTYDRNYHYLGMRGFARAGDYNTRFLLLVDGHRVNENIYNQAPIGTDFPIDVDLIDRVEVIRGPSSSIYGTNAVSDHRMSIFSFV